MEPLGPVRACAGLAARTWRRGNVGLEEVSEAGEEVEEGLLDEFEGGGCRGPTAVTCKESPQPSLGWPALLLAGGGDR